MISSPESKPFRDVLINDVPLKDVLDDEDVPLDEPLGEVPPDDAPPDNVPLDDVIDSSIVCLGAFPMADGLLIKALWGEKIFSSCCDNSTIKSIMQASNRNFKANFLPAIV